MLHPKFKVHPKSTMLLCGNADWQENIRLKKKNTENASLFKA
jgi:hypothetical protein